MSAAAKMQAAPGLLEEAERSRAEARTRLALLYRALGWKGTAGALPAICG